MPRDLSYYLQLVPTWNSDKPRFMNTLAALLQSMVDSQAMLAKMNADFDLDTAIGVQLDMVGQWIGRSRWVQMPLEGVYFSFDLPEQNVGFDHGIWLRAFDTTISYVPMDDATYRTVLQYKAIANEWDGTVPSIQDALTTLVPGTVIIDRGDVPNEVMTMEVILPGGLSNFEIAVAVQDFFIKPSGVRVNFYEGAVGGAPVFGFDINYTAAAPTPIGGFDIGAWARLVISE